MIKTDNRHSSRHDNRPSALRCWIEAMRLRTLPVSLAGVVLAMGFARLYGSYRPIVAVLCLIFATLAQIASNFANEYYDFRDGLDRAGREGPRRGVTEGDITPQSMLIATLGTLGAACGVGCSLLMFGPWWLLPIGILVALGVMAYSAGPYPLSRNGLGEVAVIVFFGLIPVNLAFFLQSGIFAEPVILGSVSAGLMGANVLIVNNYRDADDDRAVGKRTLAVILGRPAVRLIYGLNGLVAAGLMMPEWLFIGGAALAIPALYLAAHCALFAALFRLRGARLNPLLGLTAILMALYAIAFFLVA